MATKCTPVPKPVRVNPVRKLTAAVIAVLATLHESGKLMTAEVVATETGTTVKAVNTVLNKLSEMELATSNAKAQWRFSGLRCKAMRLLVDNLTITGGPMSASEIGTALWADPKVVAKDPKASVRYIAPAGAVLKTAFGIGVVYKVELAGTPPKFGLVA
jgi:hypothetical protein